MCVFNINPPGFSSGNVSKATLQRAILVAFADGNRGEVVMEGKRVNSKN